MLKVRRAPKTCSFSPAKSIVFKPLQCRNAGAANNAFANDWGPGRLAERTTRVLVVTFGMQIFCLEATLKLLAKYFDAIVLEGTAGAVVQLGDWKNEKARGNFPGNLTEL